jgi:hypothetical protein
MDAEKITLGRNKALSAQGLVAGHRGVEFDQPAIWFSGNNFEKLGGLMKVFNVHSIGIFS